MSRATTTTIVHALCGATLVLALAAFPKAAGAQACTNIVKADVVALDQVFFLNRRGACMPHGQMYALKRDVVDLTSGASCATTTCTPGKVGLRDGKRPRPLVLRMNVGDCLEISFTNLIANDRLDVQNCPECTKFEDGNPNPLPTDALEQPATRWAGVHAIGMQLVESIDDDGSFVGRPSPDGPRSLVPPGGSARYTLYAEREGQHLMYSTAATTGGQGDGGQLAMGLFGSINVEPAGSIWLRSQVTADDVAKASGGAVTPSGHPKIDYNATYADGTPIFHMLDAGGNIVHSDLTAIIAGPFAADYPPNTYTYPERDQSFREFTIIYHDELGAVQAFPQFSDPVLGFTLHGVRDAFAFNYGTGGIGSEIIANRLGVGPEANCTGCKYEEFFLTSWTLGDPAMNVDVPANACIDPITGEAIPGCGASQAFFPDDPSNVYHSYLRDHMKFRVLHAGPKEHHIHHLHAHQWLYSPDSDESSYLDSQALGPGSSFTTEIAYNGSGNRNQTVGDSIFHCHFYPHFAQGMWALWRVHDVFEDGSRKLPDAEILAGTPSPAVVPIPGLAMAPMPGVPVSIDPLSGQVLIAGVSAFDYTGSENPGYPYFIPGLAGARPPHPPMDFYDEPGVGVHDGGLPRHLLRTGGDVIQVQTRLDFTKEVHKADGFELPEQGLPVEIAAMDFHGGADVDGDGSTRTMKSPILNLNGSVGVGNFIVNGRPPSGGAPFAEPCIDDDGNPIGLDREYKAANIQLDVIFNKAGWHFPQQRLITLWGDVDDTFSGIRPPEPFFFRANSGDCITYLHTNLVPNIYEMDDFQVRTPTDILGQHIHLVKFDVTSSDGSANGWNYEDGTFSPDEVIERIKAINLGGGLEPAGGGPRITLAPKPHPYFDALGHPEFVGAQTTVQKWYADPVQNNAGRDRTLRTVFTHDHYGPSTHQQAGLYAGLVVEPRGSTWRDPQTGVIFGSRFDGGPTSWRADILTEDSDQSYREFLLEFADFQLAYETGSQPGLVEGTGPTFPNDWACHGPQPASGCPGQQPGHGAGYGVAGRGFDNRAKSINPPSKDEVFPDLLLKKDVCGEGDTGPEPPCPEAISADDPGTFVVNMRNEPVALRVRNPTSNDQAGGDAGDLALAFSSTVLRDDPVLNTTRSSWPYEPTPAGVPSPVEGAKRGDPFTPLIQAFESDRVQIRTLVGAHEEGHNFAVNGIKWQFEPSWTNSGFRNSQMMGISEHFEMIVPQLPKSPKKGTLDYLYTAGAATDDLWNGIWGLMRVHKGNSPDLLNLPNNPNGGLPVAPAQLATVDRACPANAPKAPFEIVAGTAAQLLPGGTLEYNQRNGVAMQGPLEDQHAMLYFHSDDIDPFTGKLKPGVPIEPLVLRARAGDCIEVALTNLMHDAAQPIGEGWNTLPMIVEGFNNNDIRPSSEVGLHPQLVFYDASRSDGNNVGRNAIQTAGPSETVYYQWYAGDIKIGPTGLLTFTPIEFGATNLIPADRVKQPSRGAIGALVIEPVGADWTEDSTVPGCDLPGRVRCSRASATVTHPGGPKFREFVLLFQDDVNMQCSGCGKPVAPNLVSNLAESEDPEDSGQKAINYRTEPLWFRRGFAPHTELGVTNEEDFTNILTNGEVGGDPETPVFTAPVGMEVRFRVLEPGGHARNHVFQVHGHVWQIEPYTADSTVLGDNPLSMWEGAKMGHGPTNHFDAILQNGAGGKFGVLGDYLYRDQSSFLFDGGLWGLLRVVP